MPDFDIREVDIVLAVLGCLFVLYGIISAKIKRAWYLGEALPAVVVGIILGPISAEFIHSDRWGSAEPGQTSAITLGITRVIICVQLVIAGSQLPAKYPWTRWREMAICLLPVMTTMWLCTTACIMATVPKVSFLSALVIASCVTCTDPILSQAIAKGPFADSYVSRPLREIISAEAGANDGFGFPFLMLATYLIRYADVTGAGEGGGGKEIGRLGGGVGEAMKNWAIKTWLYTVLMSAAIGAAIGYGSGKVIRLALKRRWVENESFFLFPTALGLFVVGLCGSLQTDDLLACFVAGCSLNWDGHFLREMQKRDDEVNPCIDMMLNLAGFMHIGTVIPWKEFNDPERSGLTYPRLFGLGLLVLLFRRIPAILAMHKLMPGVCKNYKDALFMGYFGPIGAGAVFYVEYARQQFPPLGEGDQEEENLVRAMAPVVYWLVFFSIVVHGLSIPVLSIVYKYLKVKPIQNDAVEIHRTSAQVPMPVNSSQIDENTFLVFNRFSQPELDAAGLPVLEGKAPEMEVEQIEVAKNEDEYEEKENKKRRREVAVCIGN